MIQVKNYAFGKRMFKIALVTLRFCYHCILRPPTVGFAELNGSDASLAVGLNYNFYSATDLRGEDTVIA